MQDGEKLFAYLRGEETRKAGHKEAVRARLSQSPVPVADDLLEDLKRLFVTDAIDVLQSHPGFRLEDRMRSVRTTCALLKAARHDLMRALDEFDSFRKLRAFAYRSGQEELQRHDTQIRKEIFSFSALAHSLRNHCCAVGSSWEPPDLHANIAQCFGNDGLSDFVPYLRNNLHHQSMVEADWHIKDVGQGETSHYMFNRAEVVFRRGCMDCWMPQVP